MPKTLKKRKNRRTQKKRRTRQMTNNKTRGRRLKNSRSSGSRTSSRRSRRSRRKMKGGAADGPSVGLLSGTTKTTSPSPTSLKSRVGDKVTSLFDSSSPVAASDSGDGGYLKLSDDEIFDFTTPGPLVIQPPVQALTPVQQQEERKKKAVDLMALAQAAVIEAGAGEAALARSRATDAVAATRERATDAVAATRERATDAVAVARERATDASASVASAAAAAAEKAKPVAVTAAKAVAAGTGLVGAAAGAPLLVAAAAPIAAAAVPVVAGLAAAGTAAVLAKKGVDKTIQFGKLMKKGADKKAFSLAVKVLYNEGWQFILPGQRVATTLDMALAWIKDNYKTATVNAPDKPDQPQLAGTPTPVSP